MDRTHKTIHSLHSDQGHLGWDNSLAPVLTVEPDETVEFHPMDASGAQLSPKSTVADVASLDFEGQSGGRAGGDRRGEPGDAVKVTILSISLMAGAGPPTYLASACLRTSSREPALHLWKVDADALTPSVYGPGGRVPLKPFCGTIGLAPGETGPQSIVPPRRVGGNMDIRDLGVGTELYLPIEVKGGLFSVGDIHAAQGDGEVCGTAIECPASMTARLLSV